MDPVATRARLERFLVQEVDHYFAETRFRAHEDDALKAVCHAVLWICALDEFHKKYSARYEAWRDAQPAHEVLLGVRFARNRGFHQFPQLVEISGGATFPITLPAPFFEIAWRSTAALPSPDASHAKHDAVLRAHYDRHLSETPVRFTLSVMRDLLLAVP